jgi:hypothetical protein
MPRRLRDTDLQTRVHTARIVFQVGGVGLLFGLILGGGNLLFIALFSLLFTGIGLLLYRLVVVGSAKLIAGAVFTDRRGFSGSGYSHIEALEAIGDIDGALAAWEATIAREPAAHGARLHAADLHIKHRQDAARAAVLFREVRQAASASADAKRYASQRLVDLYLGPLDAPGKAMAELRRCIDEWPDSREARLAREGLRRLKAQQAEEA